MTDTTQVRRTAVVTGAARGVGTAAARRPAGGGLTVGVIDLVEPDCAETVEAVTGIGGAALAVAAHAGIAGAGPRADPAKAGPIASTPSPALRLRPYGMTANAIAPGSVVSGMSRASARRLGLRFEEFRRGAAQSLPVGRVGLREFVSGRVICVAAARRAEG